MRNLLVAVLLIAACDKKAAKVEDKKPVGNSPGFVDVPGSTNLEIKVPDGVHPMQGLSGFENDDKSFTMIIKPQGDDAADIATLKSKIGENVKEWLSEQTLADGWVATYVEDGGTFGLQMRRKLGDETFKCAAGSLKTKESLEPIIKACSSMKKKI